MKNNYTILDLQISIKKSYSWKEVINDLGLKYYAGNYYHIRDLANQHNMDYSHFRKRGWNSKLINNPIPLSEILKENSTMSNQNLKIRLIKEGLKDNICEICNINSWMNQPISLQLDHINGNHNDNRLENLRILCPNCHSQTPTWSGRNILNKCEECGNKLTQSKNRRKTNFCGNCVSSKINRFHLRKVERPSKEILEIEIQNNTWIVLGIKYNVSDNAVRKWAKLYNLISK